MSFTASHWVQRWAPFSRYLDHCPSLQPSQFCSWLGSPTLIFSSKSKPQLSFLRNNASTGLDRAVPLTRGERRADAPDSYNASHWPEIAGW